MSEAPTTKARNPVGPIVHAGEIAGAVIAAAETDNPDREVTRARPRRLRARRGRRVSASCAAETIEQALGRPFRMVDLEINMPSFAGRIETTTDYFRFYVDPPAAAEPLIEEHPPCPTEPSTCGRSRHGVTWRGQRRRPSEYEIVSTNLHWHTRSDAAVGRCAERLHDRVVREVPQQSADPAAGLGRFPGPGPGRVPHATTSSRTVRRPTSTGCSTSSATRSTTSASHAEWINVPGRLYTPGRYLLHTVQMGSPTCMHMAPASTISNCAAFQAADQLRWVSRIAYRTRELAIAHPGVGFGEHEREHWEGVEAWQGFRELHRTGCWSPATGPRRSSRST